MARNIGNVFLRRKQKREIEEDRREAKAKTDRARHKAEKEAKRINPLNLAADFLARTAGSGSLLVGATAFLDPIRGKDFQPVKAIVPGLAAGAAGKGLAETIGKGGGDIIKGIGEATKLKQLPKTLRQVSALTKRDTAIPSVEQIISMTGAEEKSKKKEAEKKKKEARDTEEFELKKRNIESQIEERGGKKTSKDVKDAQAVAAEELDGQLNNQNIQDLSDIEQDLQAKDLEFYSPGEGFDLKKRYRDRDKKNIKAIRESKSLSRLEKTKKINKIKKFQKERERKFF